MTEPQQSTSQQDSPKKSQVTEDEVSSAAALRRKGRRLGRGLASLITSTSPSAPTEPAAPEASPPTQPAATPQAEEQGAPAADASATASGAPRAELRHLPVGAIAANPDQPRRRFDPDALASLAASLKANGMLQPVLVRRHPAAAGPSDYQLIAGERRWRAAQKAGLAEIPAIIKQMGDDVALELALTENIQREDLNPIERAAAYRAIMQRASISQDELAKRLGDSRANVSHYLALLDLPAGVQDHLAEGRLRFGQARPLGGLKSAEAAGRLAQVIIDRGWSVRQVEQFLAELARHPDGATLAGIEALLSGVDAAAASGQGDARPKADPPPKPANIVALEERLTERLGTRVNIRQGRRADMGKLVIDFYSLDDFDRILDALGVMMDD